MATNFNVAGAADFTNADPNKLLSDIVLRGLGTKDYFSQETGVKFATIIPYISDYSVDVSSGNASGYNAGSGQTTVVDVTLANKPLHIREHYQKSVIDKKVVGLLEPGTDPIDLPLESLIVDLKGDAVALSNETYIWQADSSTTIQSAGTTLNGADGVLAQLRTGAGAFGDAAISFQAVSDVSILEHVKSLVDVMATSVTKYVLADTIMAMSPANFQAYARAVNNLNGTIDANTIGADGKPKQDMMVPGTMIKAVSMIGLQGKNNIVVTIPENIIAVYDLVDESEQMNMLYNPFAKQYELTAEWKLGAKVVDVSNCIVSQ